MYQKIKDHLIPHQGNNFAPPILQKTAMLGMLGLVLLSFLVANFQALLWQSSSWLVGAVLPAIVTDLTNQERANLVLPLLKRNPILDQAAQLKANDMAVNGYFAHNSPTGITPWYWFGQVGYLFTYAGENLAVHFSDSDEVVSAWMASPTHRANIVNSNYTEIGIGTARGIYQGYETVFVVQLFGRPAMKSLLPLITKKESINEQPSVITDISTTSESVLANNDLSLKILGAEVTTPTSTPLVVKDEDEKAVTLVTNNVPVLSDQDMGSPQTADVANLKPEIVVDNDNFIMYLDTISTSTNLTPLPVELLANNTTGTTTPIIARLATKPNNILQLLYLIIGFFTISCLLLSVLIEWRKQQLLQVFYGVLLLFLMSGLFYIHVTITAGAMVV
ncbi:hypothetical protein COZ82_02025 [Candidatus Kaiserbacteria bacterium CG_4_8_14_3_um_filter_38_9]|uniref:SCP domain-containing protein n=1 Tax=Candidatus Kaiserbacteria bacterium CG_4_8_14_3_um_filter_38_9 TaxID=1974599 RepID=A0A2M7INX9_9BACT|nr:MAG: hypothetical protein COZ82_02025 [Candidatus Kaiserbacteria bacterium CG_4_8_14_3_um_filter_38_9]